MALCSCSMAGTEACFRCQLTKTLESIPTKREPMFVSRNEYEKASKLTLKEFLEGGLNE
jgi:hypothetical protein